MRSRLIWMCVTLVLLVAVASWQRLADDVDRSQAASRPFATETRSPAERSAPSRAARAAAIPAPAARIADPAVPAAAPAAVNVQPEEIGLRLDAAGHLVKNATTRDEIERILSGDPARIDTARQEMLDNLPPAAAREALDLLDRFSNYRAALRQVLPQSTVAPTQQDALVMLDTLHDMRVTYFGAELTEAFFGAEEAIGRGTAAGIRNAGPDAR